MRVGPPRNEHPGRLPDTDGAPILAGRRTNVKQGGKLFAGLDWASKTHMVCVVDDAGEIKIRFEIANTGKTFTGLVKRLTKLGVEGVAIERCDGPLVEALLEAGLRVVVITPRQVKGVRSRYSGSGGRSWPTPRRPRCTRSSPKTSSPAPPSSPTPGRATAASTSSATPTTGAASARGEDPGELLPGVHRIASPAKRWLLGTHQGSVDEAHLQSYLNEFAFRFNRRRSTSRGMVFYRVLELAVGHGRVRYRDLVVDPQHKATRPGPPGTGGHPPSLDRPRAERPGAPPTCDSPAS
jgi:hypothetical protein